MNSFEYFNPTRIVFGQHTISRLDTLLPENARVLVLYGGGSAEKTGTLNEVRQTLGTRFFQEFGGIEANPEYATLLKAVQLVHDKQINFLLAVGGGSVIDGTKFVAAATFYETDPWNMFLDRGKSIKRALPLGTVLTMPATGSEMNCRAVVNRSEIQAKRSFYCPHIFPAFSILDPTKTLTLPMRQVINGIVDTFVHVAEQYITYPVNAQVQDRYAESLLQVVISEGPKALENPEDLGVRANLMWAATMALNDLIATGVPQDWSTHMIGHEMTALFGMDHARTLAVVLPGLWKVCQEEKREKLLQLAERVWGITEGTEAARIAAAISKTETFFQSLGVQTRLGDYGLGKTDVEAILQQLEKHGMTALGERGSITLEISKKILEDRLEHST